MLRGRFDLITNDKAFGWAYDDSSPNSRLNVVLKIDGARIDVRTANLYRTDLEEAQIDDGFHGFAIPIPKHVQDGQLHKLELTCIELPGEEIENSGIDVLIPIAELERTKAIGDTIDLIFDRDYYLDQAGPTEDPVKHYQKIGWKLGFDPGPLFSTSYYITNLNRQLDVDPLTDFFNRGAREWTEVHPLLDVNEYLRIRPDLIPNKLHPLLHYLEYGWKENVGAFRLFDLDFYNSQCPGLVEAGYKPIVHYLRHGWIEGRKPNRLFDPLLFAKLDGLSSSSEPFTHFIRSSLDSRRASKRCCEISQSAETSIIILNFNKSLITLQSIYFINKHTSGLAYEVVVVDNGSSIDEFKLLTDYCGDCKVVRSEVNLGFGEGNNIGVENSIGNDLVFVNNDAFVTSGWLKPLTDALQEEGVGGSGPAFFYPNGSLQECGGSVFGDGTVHQRGKGLSSTNFPYDQAEYVTYISAATFAVRKATFLDVYGFDLMWDPAYYEDVDLCLKIQAFGYQIKYVPQSKVIHLEGTTSSDPSLRLNDIVATNRLKFIQRWQKWLNGGMRSGESNFDFPKYSSYATRQKPILALFTPYPMNPGGGERYLLSIAHALRDNFDCVLFTPKLMSRIRLLTMAREFGLDLQHVKCEKWSDRGKFRQPDVFFSMGNEVLPYAEAIGKKSFYICQFPFPMNAHSYGRDWGKFDCYHAVILYSEFSLKAYTKAHADIRLAQKPTFIIHPPVELIQGSISRSDVKKIVNVGRFNPGGHCKRQDVMIETFRELCRYNDRPIELHLAGSLPEDGGARQYFAGLQKMSEGLNVHFHVNASAHDLRSLYLQSDIYWHITGINDSIYINPERFEHFGITIVEAMSAGCFPIVLGYGGPAEIVENGISGIHIKDTGGLLASTDSILDEAPEKLEYSQKNIIERASAFGYQEFSQALRNLMQ